MSTKMWEAVLEHARTCVLANQMHVYRHPDGSQKQQAVVFNVVGELKGVISEQGQFVSVDDLSEKETVCFFPSFGCFTNIMYMFMQYTRLFQTDLCQFQVSIVDNHICKSYHYRFPELPCICKWYLVFQHL